MTTVALVAGYLVGSIPTAVWLGRLWGVDLRSAGTGNPGANNARKLGGFRLAALVLLAEIAKGGAAVALGFAISAESGAVAAGLGAIAGNVYNVWFGFSGGKGLAITGGVLLGVWPVMFPAVVVVLIVSTALARSTGIGALVSLGFLVLGALAWNQLGLSDAWGVAEPRLLLLTALGISLIIARKHLRDARQKLSSRARPVSRG